MLWNQGQSLIWRRTLASREAFGIILEFQEGINTFVGE
jgi:hypothetical protein